MDEKCEFIRNFDKINIFIHIVITQKRITVGKNLKFYQMFILVLSTHG